MNVSELLRLLQTEHDETAARADNLREQIERLTTVLAETEARLAELAATRKVIDGLTPPDHATAPAERVGAGVVRSRSDGRPHQLEAGRLAPAAIAPLGGRSNPRSGERPPSGNVRRIRLVSVQAYFAIRSFSFCPP
ncbi:hypothetical protein ABZZ20_34035 [Streptomyces sp. NPDC006430]|uniref:hypothetical protein n=1 Tax=Streptomyces sp. NPDC006430 TaxID=3154299 RepID=UPI0033BF6DAD